MESFIIKLLILVILAVGMTWGGLKQDREWVLVKYNKFSIFVTTLFLLFFAVVTYSAFTAEKGATNFALIILSSITILAIFAANEVYRAKAWFDDEKIYFHSPYGKKITINYENIISCELTKYSGYVITSNNGDKAKLSPYMSGINEMINFVQFKINQH